MRTPLAALHHDVILAAALSAARTGLVVRLVIPREMSAVPAACTLAAQVGVEVTVELRPTAIRLRFGPDASTRPGSH
jgi:hypothetical protein